MVNYQFNDNKTLFDIFNMLSPNCYQAFAISAIIENKKSEAIKYLEQMETAVKYYNWKIDDKKCNYIDSLICTSKLEKWQKLAFMCIISNDIEKCKNIINEEINNILIKAEVKNDVQNSKSEELSRINSKHKSIRSEDLDRVLLDSLFNFNSYPFSSFSRRFW